MEGSFPKTSYLDRRAHHRVSHHYTAQFIVDPSHPLRLGKALTQDLSLTGVQILTSVVPEIDRSFDIWIPVDGQEIVKAKATTEWMSIEDTLADSSYWTRVGLSLTYFRLADKQIVSQELSRKIRIEQDQEIQSVTKVSYVF